MLSSVLISIVFSLFVGSGAKSGHSRIIGGEDADIIDYPYQVSLRINGYYACGGSIVSKRHILTVAACIANDTAVLKRYTIHTGSKYSTGPIGKNFTMKKVDIHAGFIGADTWFKNDIAIITLTKDIEFDERTQKINIASKPAQYGDNAILTGWGVNHNITYRAASAFVLQKINMTILTKEWCEKLHPPFSQIQIGQICAFQRAEVGVCHGDTGSPLVVRNEVVGIVSWNYACAISIPDVYTDVYFFEHWIKQKIEINGAFSVVNSIIILIMCVSTQYLY